MQYRRIIISLIISILLSYPTHSNAESNQDSFELAVTLIEVDGTAAAIDTLIPSLVRQHEAVLRSIHPDMSAQGLGQYSAYLLEELVEQKEELITLFAGLYLKHFTLEEMETLHAFYQTSTGRKAVTISIHMQPEIMSLTYEWGTKAVQRASKRVHTRLEEEGTRL